MRSSNQRSSNIAKLITVRKRNTTPSQIQPAVNAGLTQQGEIPLPLKKERDQIKPEGTRTRGLDAGGSVELGSCNNT
jgi:hypothetical protein